MNPEEIKEIRHGLGLSQEKFAEVLGVESGNISKWENGVNRLSKGAAMMYKLFAFVIKIKKQKQFLNWLKK